MEMDCDSNTFDEASNDTMKKLLIEKKVLICASCRNLLQTPVFLVDKIGSVCQKCFGASDWQGVRQTIFDLILENITSSPCQNEGCLARILPEDCESHLKNCSHRPMRCIDKKCPWSGKLDELVEHFEAQHQNDVAETLAFNFDTTSQQYFAKLLKRKNAQYFLVIKVEPGGDIFYSMYKVDAEGDLNATICCDSAKQDCRLEIGIVPLNMIDDETASVAARLSGISGAMLITVEMPSSKTEQLLQHLECPSCLDTMKPPIYQCIRGHSFCNTCTSSSSQCPMCRAFLNKELRNHSLEALTSDVLYACAYRALGCDVRVSGKHIKQHESNCPCTAYLCPLPECSFRNNMDLFKKHVENDHTEVLQISKYTFSSRFATSGDSNHSIHMYVEGCIFTVNFSFNKPSNAASDGKYVCEIKMLMNNVRMRYGCEIIMENPENGRKLSFKKTVPRADGLIVELTNSSIKKYCDSDSLEYLNFALHIFKSNQMFL